MPLRGGPATRTARRGGPRGVENTVVVLVDLNRCQTYGQCVFAAPAVFRLPHPETLEWDYRPAADEAERVERARHACPVQAITVAPEPPDAELPGAPQPSGVTQESIPPGAASARSGS